MKFEHWQEGLYGDISHYDEKNIEAKNERTRILTMLVNDLSPALNSEQKELMTVCEWGCNTGRNLLPFYYSGYKIAGYDINKEALTTAARRMFGGHINHFHRVDLYNDVELLDTIPVDVYDFSITMGFLMHIPKGKKKTKLIKSIIRSSKRTIFYEPIGNLERTEENGWHLSLEDYGVYSKKLTLMGPEIHEHPDNHNMRIWALLKEGV